MIDNIDYIFEDIESCICVGEYNDEYVYDIEMDDDTHTFICNDVLVHNSAYITVNPLLESCQIPEYMGSRFIHAIYKFSLKKYIEKCLDEYAIAYNCDKNVEEFELEKVARTVIYLAKKHYVMDIAWADGSGDGKFIEPLKKIICVGIEVVQGSTSPWCRKTQKEFIAWLLDFYNNDKKPEYSEIVNKIKEYRKMFELQDPDSIFKAVNLNNYEKYVLDDKTCIKFSDAPQIPQHASASAKYNYTLYNKAKKYLSKYNIIKKGDRVKVYYVNENESFAYLPYAFPIEFAEPIDFDTNFEKLMLQPLNRLIEAAGFQPVPKGLTYSAPLW